MTDIQAFPVIGTHEEVLEAGMMLRDYFAAKAMQGLMGRDWSGHEGTDEELIDIWARSAYGVAEAMLRAREAK